MHCHGLYSKPPKYFYLWADILREDTLYRSLTIRQLKRIDYEKISVLLLLLAFSSPTFADVHKWKDADGKTHYGDAPNLAGTVKVKADKQTDDQIANGQRIKAGTTNNNSQGAARESKCEELLGQLNDNRLGDIGSKSITEIATIKARRKEITQEYELQCRGR